MAWFASVDHKGTLSLQAPTNWQLLFDSAPLPENYEALLAHVEEDYRAAFLDMWAHWVDNGTLRSNNLSLFWSTNPSSAAQPLGLLWKWGICDDALHIMCTEFTEKLRKQRQRATERVRLLKLFEHQNCSYFLHDIKGDVLDINERAAKQLGYTREELLKLHVSDIETTMQPGSLEGIWESMERNVPIQIEGAHRTASGKVLPVNVSITSFEEFGEPRFIAQCFYISEQKQREAALNQLNAELQEHRNEALRATRAKSEFLANMSHELRTPLNAIIGYVEMVQDELLDNDANEEQIEDLGKALRSSRHLLSLLNGILDLSKVESNRMEVNWKSISLGTLLHEVRDVVRPVIEKSTNQLTITQQDAIDIRTDETKLKQVLLNLLSNAAKFTTEGSITLDANITEESGRPCVQLSIHDTGTGIPADRLESIFEPFFQLKNQPTHQKGTGLGLAISRQLCRLLGAELSAQSEPGQGSTFTITLPFDGETQPLFGLDGKRIPVTPIHFPQTKDEAQATHTTQAPVLVFDHNSNTHTHIRQYLLPMKQRIQSVYKYQQALDVIETITPPFVYVAESTILLESTKQLAPFFRQLNARAIPMILMRSSTEPPGRFGVQWSGILETPLSKEAFTRLHCELQNEHHGS
jgi:PAS domain S-box-containing protein